MARQQLPPQIRKISVRDRKSGRQHTRYEVTVDTGSKTTVKVDAAGLPQTVTRRTQSRRRYSTEQAARSALAETLNSVNDGLYVHTSQLTVEMAVNYWLESKHSLKPSSLHGHRTNLQPVISELGHIPVQKLTKPNVECLVRNLRNGGLPTKQGRPRKPWSARTVNYVLGLITAILQDQMKQGNVIRNVGAMVIRLPAEATEMQTHSKLEVDKLVAHVAREPMQRAWQLAMHGMRRGEIAGLRWEDVDLDKAKLKSPTPASRLAATSSRVRQRRRSLDGRFPSPNHSRQRYGRHERSRPGTS